MRPRRSRTQPPRSPATARPRLEGLEARDLPSGLAGDALPLPAPHSPTPPALTAAANEDASGPSAQATPADSADPKTPVASAQAADPKALDVSATADSAPPATTPVASATAADSGAPPSAPTASDTKPKSATASTEASAALKAVPAAGEDARTTGDASLAQAVAAIAPDAGAPDATAAVASAPVAAPTADSPARPAASATTSASPKSSLSAPAAVASPAPSAAVSAASESSPEGGGYLSAALARAFAPTATAAANPSGFGLGDLARATSFTGLAAYPGGRSTPSGVSPPILGAFSGLARSPAESGEAYHARMLHFALPPEAPAAEPDFDADSDPVEVSPEGPAALPCLPWLAGLLSPGHLWEPAFALPSSADPAEVWGGDLPGSLLDPRWLACSVLVLTAAEVARRQARAEAPAAVEVPGVTGPGGLGG